MSTYMAKKGDLERKWFVLDAAGKPLGKTAVAAADLLRGKTKPEFTPTLTAAISSSSSTRTRRSSRATKQRKSFIGTIPAGPAV